MVLAYRLCETYPQKVIVPKSLSDEELRAASEGRFLNRFPAVVWRCKEKETVLLRSSQPRVGLFSYRYPQDERILECVRNALPEGQFIILLNRDLYFTTLSDVNLYISRICLPMGLAVIFY